MNDNGTTETGLVPVQHSLQKSDPEVLSKLSFEPRNAEEAFQAGKWAVGSGFLGKNTTAEQAFMLIAKGRELGMGFCASLDAFSVIQGAPRLKPEVMLALVLSYKGNVCKCVETTPERAVWKAHDRDDPDPEFTVIEWTMDMARGFDEADRKANERKKKSGKGYPTTPFLERDQWVAQPQNMLRWRGLAAICRLVFPHIIRGLYTPDEALDIKVEPKKAEVVTTAEPKAGPRSTQLVERLKGKAEVSDPTEPIATTEAEVVPISDEAEAQELRGEIERIKGELIELAGESHAIEPEAAKAVVRVGWMGRDGPGRFDSGVSNPTTLRNKLLQASRLFREFELAFLVRGHLRDLRGLEIEPPKPGFDLALLSKPWEVGPFELERYSAALELAKGNADTPWDGDLKSDSR